MSKCVLIVDDDEDLRAIAKLGLEMGGGWIVLSAGSGEEALSLAAEHQPDVILLDMMMPDMDGRATLKRLKANPSTQAIPVILLTAKVNSADPDSFKDMQVNAILAKPIRPLLLAEQISTLLSW
jgi:CheY-like chemotaxis protein